MMGVAGKGCALIALIVAVSGCAALGRMAANQVGNTLSSGGSVFASDEDPDLVLEAIPFGLKTYESLLAVTPKHRGLLLAAASGFAAYAALLQQQGQLDAQLDYGEEQRLQRRVSRLFLRSRDYALRGLALDFPDLTTELSSDAHAALAGMRPSDVPLLYWAGLGWAGAVSTAKDDPALIAELPIAAALMSRALQLDDTYDAGAIHEFFVTYEGSRPGGDVSAARGHFERALALSEGEKASVYLALAESVSVREQDLLEFRSLVQRALAVDPDGVARWRVINTLGHRRAEWLADHESDLFIEIEEN